jgi:nucleotide-binding universal stress UspA family protein
MFHDVLVPVDLTAKNRSAVDVASELAAQAAQDGRVTLLHVIETIDHVPFEELEDFYSTLQEKAEAGLAELAASLPQLAGEVRQRVVFGHRARAIVEYAEEAGCDLVVLSSHRVDPQRRGEDWATLSHKVAILAPCPVLLVK